MSMNYEAKNLSYRLGDSYLFRRINFKLSPGECLHIQGHNGAGKSTLLKILAGLAIAQKGTITWQQNNIHAKPEQYYAAMSYLGHKDGIKRALTPYENIMNCTTNENRCSVAELHALLTTFQLVPLMHRFCYQLSAGQKRKVALASLILQKKPLWILDEPFTTLDLQSSHCFKQIMDQHLHQGGIIVLASHRVEEEANYQHINLSADVNSVC